MKIFLVIGILFISPALFAGAATGGAQSCGIPNGAGALTQTNMQKFFKGQAGWVSTESASSLNSSSLKDGITRVRLNFANIASSNFSVQYLDKETGKTVEQSAPKKNIRFENCRLKFEISYKGPGQKTPSEYSVSLFVTGSPSAPRMNVSISAGILGMNLSMAPADKVKIQKAEGPELHEFDSNEATVSS